MEYSKAESKLRARLISEIEEMLSEISTLLEVPTTPTQTKLKVVK